MTGLRNDVDQGTLAEPTGACAPRMNLLPQETDPMSGVIAPSLTAEHRRCDRLLSVVERAAEAAEWERVPAEVRALAEATEAHFRLEEEGLFPALEAAAPAAGGPTSVMRMEHQQIRQMLDDLRAAAAARDKAECLGLLETLHLLVQQHNAKEEAILYPLADRTLGERADAILGERGAA
jgi:hemerythrin-like domain-containing protein